MKLATQVLVVALALVVGAPARAETPAPKKIGKRVELKVLGPSGADAPVYGAADLDALFGGQVVGQLRGERFGPNAVLLVVDIDGVERLHLREAPSSGCEALRPIPGQAPLGVELAPCGASCPGGRAFARPTSKAGPEVSARPLSGPPFPDGYTADVAITGADWAAKTARGHVTLTAGDGTAVDADFEAKVCASRQRARKAAPVGGLGWATRPVPAAGLPRSPLAGFLVDRPVTGLAARLVPDGAGYQLALYAGPASCEPPAVAALRPGGPDLIYLSVGVDELRAGAALTAESWVDGRRDGRTVVLAWAEPDLEADAIQPDDHAVTVTFDAVDLAAGEARGRLYAAFGDRGKTLLVGAFTAAVCPAQ